MPKNNTNNIHAQRLKAIRPFVSFDFDLRRELTPYQKSKIKTYYEEIKQLTARPYYVYRPRIKSHLKKAQKYAQHEKPLRDLKVAFIPTNGSDKPEISFNKNGDIIVKFRDMRVDFIAFDPVALAENPEHHAQELIADANAKRFIILAGKYEIPHSYSKSRVPSAVAKLAGRYSNPLLNNYFGNWLVGLAAYNFNNQADFNEYARAKNAAKKRHKKERKNRKRRTKKSGEF